MRLLPIRGDPDLYHTLARGAILMAVVSMATVLPSARLAAMLQTTMTEKVLRQDRCELRLATSALFTLHFFNHLL
jgi:hypothetical protein